jgi:hypothetical protein
MPLEFFAPGIFIEEAPWRARQVRSTERWFDGHARPGAPSARSGSSSADAASAQRLRVSEQAVMLVFENRRDGPWGFPF